MLGRARLAIALRRARSVLRRTARLTRRCVDRARGRRHRSVLFLHHSYYHFYYLAAALRRRGWDAITVSIEDPQGPHANYYHGEDVNLFDPDPDRFHRNIERCFDDALGRFDVLHFAGDGIMSFFAEHWASDAPPDIVAWRRHGGKVAYTVAGCNDGVRQSSVRRWSLSGGKAVCDHCPWRDRPEICSDAKSEAWGSKVDRYCDVVFSETTPALDHQDGPKVVREPTTMCLDREVWRPDLPVPDALRISRTPGEILVYHGVGNYDLRTRNGENIKGTSAIVAAIDRLRAEGVPVRLIFATQMRNIDVRFVQVQADIVVDQLNYGRYGAQAREAMMLGKPTVCYLNLGEPAGTRRLSSLAEVPLVSATEETLYEVLLELLQDGDRRRRLGERSRAYALKWHEADMCAERYEWICDRLMQGASAEYPPVWGGGRYTR